MLCMLCTVMFGSLAAHADSSDVYAGDSIRWVSMRAYKQSYNNICVDIQVNYTNYPDYYTGEDNLKVSTYVETTLNYAVTYLADGTNIDIANKSSQSIVSYPEHHYEWNFRITRHTVDIDYDAPIYGFQATIQFPYLIDHNTPQSISFDIAGLSRTLTFVPSAL